MCMLPFEGMESHHVNFCGMATLAAAASAMACYMALCICWSILSCIILLPLSCSFSISTNFDSWRLQWWQCLEDRLLLGASGLAHLSNLIRVLFLWAAQCRGSA